MIHKYKLGDYNVVLDVNSGGVHVVDELTYDMLDNIAPPFAPECPEEVVTKLSRFYDPEEIRSCYAEILEAYDEGILFSPDDYEKYANFAVASPIKAMCLNIAHDCNLRCQYCFASTGDFGEGRKLMSYETGKKAVDFRGSCESGNGLLRRRTADELRDRQENRGIRPFSGTGLQ